VSNALVTRQPLNLAQLTNPWIKMVIYGSTGVGKTVFCGQSQRYRTFIFDVDDGAFAAATWRGNPNLGIPGTRRDLVDVWPTRSREDFQAGFDWLVKYQQHYGLAVVDTATELQRQILREVATRFKLETPDQRTWGVGLNAMEAIAASFRHLPMHVIWVCHEIEKDDPELHRTMYRPSFQGAFATAYAKHFTLIARYCLFDNIIRDANGAMIGTDTQRWLNCERDQTTHAKNRGGFLNKWELPNLDAIIDKMVQACQATAYDYTVVDQTPVTVQAALPAAQAALPAAA
jgi:hypothetical protein